MPSLFYPFKAERGRLVLATGLLELKHKIIFLLRTRLGERILLKSFGIQDYAFEASTRSDIESEISQQILRFFPEVSEVRVSAKRDDTGLLSVTLSVGDIPPFNVTLE